MIDEELQAELDAVIEEVRRERARAIDEHAEFQLTLEGKHPHRAFRGRGAAWNFTIGPAFVWQGPPSVEAVNAVKDPVVIFADYIDLDTLRKVNVTRVRGYVFARGSIIDPAYWWLVDENRASITCCPEAVAAVRHGETAVIDGVRGVVYLDPDPQTRSNYERLRQIGPPRRDKLFWDALQQMCGAIMGNFRLRKVEPPYDFPEQERLVALARSARDGAKIPEEEDTWMQGLLMEGMPSIDEIQQRATGKSFDKSGKTKKADAERKDRASRDRSSRARRGRGTADKDTAKKDTAEKDTAKKDAAAKSAADKGTADKATGTGKRTASGKGSGVSTKRTTKRGGAAERRRARLEQILAERRRRRGEEEPPKDKPPKEAPPEDSGGDDDFDPLGGMIG